MSFSSFTSNISRPSGNPAANYSGLQNYSQVTGINNVKLDSNYSDIWAAAESNDWSKQFATSNVPDFGGNLLDTPAAGAPAEAFTFITSPQSVSYSQSAEVQQVSIFGTNNPPLTVAGNNAGELQLSEALMEGFVLGKQVLQPILNLLKLQEVTLSNGFVNVPVYTVYAGQGAGSGRTYGNYVIENIEVDEMMRDFSGTTTRAMVNVSFKEVPDYQINTGRDTATSTSAGQGIKSTNNATGQTGSQDALTRGANGGRGTAAGGAAGDAASGGGGGGGSSGGGGATANRSARAEACRRLGRPANC